MRIQSKDQIQGYSQVTSLNVIQCKNFIGLTPASKLNSTQTLAHSHGPPPGPSKVGWEGESEKR